MTDRCGSSRSLRNPRVIFPSWLLTIYLPKNTIGGFTFLHALPLQNVLLVDFLVMTVLAGVRWYHLVVLICSYQIIKNAQHHFKCFFQKKTKKSKKRTLTLPLKTGFLKVLPVYHFFQLPTPEHFWRPDVFYSPTGLVTMKYPQQRFSSCCYRKCPQATAFLAAPFRLFGQQASKIKLCSWFVDSSGMGQKKTPGLMSGYFFSLTMYPQDNPKPSHNWDAEDTVVPKWGDSKEGAAGGAAAPGDLETRYFSELLWPRGPLSFCAPGLAEL